jgi:hypothetical protein
MLLGVDRGDRRTVRRRTGGARRNRFDPDHVEVIMRDQPA